jgi:hypothetical protein
MLGRQVLSREDERQNDMGDGRFAPRRCRGYSSSKWSLPGKLGVISEGRPGGLDRLCEGTLRPWLAYHMARTRAGPPDAPFTLGKPTMIVAPRAGIFPRFARFSSPHLLAGKIV